MRDHRSRIGSRWRALSPQHQRLPVLVYPRRNATFARPAAAFGIGAATAHRYVTEVIALLRRQGLPGSRRRDRLPYKRKKLFNRHHAQVRALGEQGAATLKRWHILRKARCSPGRLTATVQAILTPHHQAG